MPFWRRNSMTDTVKSYVDALNRRDLDFVASKLADDMKLVDSSGDEVSGKAQCMVVLQNLLAEAPDYRMLIDTLSTTGQWVLMRGSTQSRNPRFNADMQFRALVDRGHIHEWQSFSGRPARMLHRLLNGDEKQCPAA